MYILSSVASHFTIIRFNSLDHPIGAQKYGDPLVDGVRLDI